MRYFDLTKNDRSVPQAIDDLRHTLEDLNAIVLGALTREGVYKL